MPTPPLVSVIIPTYDRPGMLREALNSALKQTYPNIEVIVSDDGANPETPKVVESMQDARVRYRRNPENLGEIRNNQAAYREAQGKYIANLHDDDFWMPTFLERLVPPLEEHPEATIAFCDHYIANRDGSLDLEHTEINTRRWRRDRLDPGLHRPFWREALLYESVPVAMASVFRASAFNPDDLRTEARASYDKWIAYLLCRDGQAAYYHPERLTAYRIHSGQESAKSSVNWAAGEVFCAETWVADPHLSDIADDLRHFAFHRRVNLGKELIRSGRLREARKYLWSALWGDLSRTLPLLTISFLPPRIAQQILRLHDRLHHWLPIRRNEGSFRPPPFPVSLLP